MNELNLFSSFSLKGVFWLSSSPERRVRGVLSFDSTEGPSLDLHGSFNMGSSNFKHSVFYGVAQGQLCTLHKCVLIGGTGHLGQHGFERYETYKAVHLFLGEHFQPDEDRFTSLQVSFTKIEEWFFHRAFSLAENADESIDATAVFKRYPIPVVEVDGIGAVVDFDYDAKIKDPSFREMRWETELFLQIKPREKKKVFEFYRSQIKNLQYLMTLLTGAPTFPRSVSLKRDESTSPVQMFYADRNACENEKVDFVQMITLFPRIQEYWANVLNNWFSKAEKLRSAMVLLFETMFRPTTVEMDFLRVAQALESYHRSRGSAVYLSEEDYKTKVYDVLVKTIPAELAHSLKSSLRSKLKYGNEYSLRKRLAELMREIPDDVLRLIKFSDVEKRVGDIVDNRNYLTHYSDELKANKAETAELWELGKALEVVLIFQLFKETGLPSELFQDRLISRYHTVFNQPT